MKERRWNAREKAAAAECEREAMDVAAAEYVMPMHERETAECEREAMDVAAAERERERESDGLEMQTR